MNIKTIKAQNVEVYTATCDRCGKVLGSIFKTQMQQYIAQHQRYCKGGNKNGNQ